MQTADYPWLQTPIFEEKRKVQRLVLSANIKHYNNRIVDFFPPQLHGCACSLPSSLLNFKTSLNQTHLGYTSCPIFLPSEHRSSAFILSLKLRYQTL